MNAKLRTFIAYAIPILILAASIAVMIVQPGWTKRVGGDEFLNHINRLQSQVEAGEWDNARREIKSLQQEYRSIVPRIQFSVERDEVNQIGTALAQIEAYVICHDRSEAMASIFIVREHWNSLDH